MSTSDKIFDCIPVMRNLAQSFLDGITDFESGGRLPAPHLAGPVPDTGGREAGHDSHLHRQ